jgi:site-specific recombinase XerD
MDAVSRVTLSPPDSERSLLYWIEVYLALEVAAYRSPHTQTAKKRDLTLFADWFLTNHPRMDIAQWSRRETSQFLERLRPENRPATINRRLATLKHFAKFCQRLGTFVEGDPTENIEDLPCEPARPRSLSRLQLSRLYQAAEALLQAPVRRHAMPLRDRAILWTLAQTGMRVTSLCALELSQFDGRYLRGVQSKGTKKQDHFLPQQAQRALEGWLAQRGAEPGPLFWSISRRRMDRSDVAQSLRKIADRANLGIPESERIQVNPHLFRHTVAQELCDRHGESFAVEKLGHSSPRYIRRYLRRPAELEEKMLEEALAG